MIIYSILKLPIIKIFKHLAVFILFISLIYGTAYLFRYNDAKYYSGGYHKSYNDCGLIDKTINKINNTNSDTIVANFGYDKYDDKGTISLHTTDTTYIQFDCNKYDITISYYTKIRYKTYKSVKILNITDYLTCYNIRKSLYNMIIRFDENKINNSIPCDKSKQLQKSFNL